MLNLLQSIIRFFYKNPWPAIFWTLLILVACTWPGKDIPAAPVVGFDKIVHAGLFIGWIVLWCLAYPHKRKMLVVIGMAYGLGLEFYQQLLPFERTFDWWDAVADAAGVLLGYSIVSLIQDTYRQRLY